MFKYSFGIKKATIFCIILTNPKNFATRTLAVHDTWAKECDNHKFITVIPKPYLKFANIKRQSIESEYPFNLLQPRGHYKENYKNLTSKVISAFLDIYKRYSNYDWYLKADDDTFIMMDNLRSFLKDKRSYQPGTFGFNLKTWQSGGAGYVFSHHSLQKFGSNYEKNSSFCVNTGTEDLDMIGCFRNLNINQSKTEDSLGRERFHLLSINDHWYGVPFKWVHDYALVPVKDGKMCCSDQSISFHYIDHKLMRRMHFRWRSYLEESKRNKNVDFHEYFIKPFVNFTSKDLNQNKFLINF
ncbi:unnamed protein product [Brachionus calyciflorus]|uniref:N-acetylgalactosaminide beta-1,3-galactosyltransferase n=1 Tax=Brachionus calyciflorus TaxID=104777 RepID=A0A813T8J8_9BILA|nr:unnamed protein product [Brachionus calyciflorus]